MGVKVSPRGKLIYNISVIVNSILRGSKPPSRFIFFATYVCYSPDSVSVTCIRTICILVFVTFLNYFGIFSKSIDC